MHAESHSPPDWDGRKRIFQREWELATLATRQHGVIARRQLIALGLGRGALVNRLKLGRLHLLHSGVYAVGHVRISQRGRWMAAVLASGEGTLLSHRSAAALWALMGAPTSPVNVTSSHGRQGRPGIALHKGRIHPEDRTATDGIPVTSIARTLLDLAEAVDRARLERVFEEADRLGLLDLHALQRVCDRGQGRRGLGAVQKLVVSAYRAPETRSQLENRFADFCRTHHLPPPVHNPLVLDFEVDVLWPGEKLIVELDGFAYHRHRAAFERDRARDAALQVAGYRVIRLTHRRLADDAASIAAEIRRLLGGFGATGFRASRGAGPA